MQSRKENLSTKGPSSKTSQQQGPMAVGNDFLQQTLCKIKVLQL